MLKISTDSMIFLILAALIVVVVWRNYYGKKSNEKTYKYIQFLQFENDFYGVKIKEDDEVIIISDSDSSAYLQAFLKFWTYSKASSEIRSSGDIPAPKPIMFKLLNEDGDDISYKTVFDTREEKENEILESINYVLEDLDRERKSKGKSSSE